MAVALAACLCVLTAYAKQEPTDHPLIKRLDGARVDSYDFKDFDSAKIVTEKIADAEAPVGLLTLDGEVSRIVYELPENISLRHAQVSYRKALGQGGFKTLLDCSLAADCGEGMKEILNTTALADTSNSYPQTKASSSDFVQVFRGQYLGRDTYVLIVGVAYAASQYVAQQIVTIADAADIVSVASPEQLAAQIGAAGSATVSGIYFDHDQSAVKPESRPALEAVAAFLKNQPSTKVYVVGHTDSEGSFSHNQQLSEARAKAVSAYLSQELGVDAARLQAYGVGPLTPVASNDSEDGRGSNRRVSIVKQ